MATTILSNITAHGTKAVFMNALDILPSVWDKHTQLIQSDGPDERHVWLGMVQEPREFVSGRSFVGISDFTFTLTNNEYELSTIIDQNTLEDDQHDLIKKRVNAMAEIWATFKDSLFGTQLINAETNTAFDGTAYHTGTRTIGTSANIDNTGTANITDPDAPSVDNVKDALKEAIESMWRYEDDTGRAGYNTLAMQTLRAVVPPEQVRIFTEVINSLLTGGGDSNPFYNNIAEIDILPYLTDADNAFYLEAVGDVNRMPHIYQERTPLQVNVFTTPNEMADNHGLKILTRQRFVMGLGEPRRSFRYDFT